jgi:death-on-curing protein
VEPLFLTVDEVLRLHDEPIRRYGGTAGVRDIGLLQSALSMPAASFGGEFLHPGLPAMAAALLFHIVQNHPFLDGNKRTGLAAARLLLWMNDVRFEPPNHEIEALVLAVAGGNADKEAATEFFAQHTK